MKHDIMEEYVPTQQIQIGASLCCNSLPAVDIARFLVCNVIIGKLAITKLVLRDVYT